MPMTAIGVVKLLFFLFSKSGEICSSGADSVSTDSVDTDSAGTGSVGIGSVGVAAAGEISFSMMENIPVWFTVNVTSFCLAL